MHRFKTGFLAVVAAVVLAGDALARDIVDMTGRTVTVPDKIERVVTLGSVPVINSFVFAAGKADTLVSGLPVRFNAKRWSWQFVFAPQLRDGPDLQDANYAPDPEKILNARPDVALSFEKSTADILGANGVPTVLLRIQTPDDVKAGVRLVGNLLGNTDIGEQYAKYFDATLARIAAKIDAIPLDQRPTALYINPTNMTQPHLVAEWWLRAGGARSVTDNGRSEEVLTLSTETVIDANPDYIVLSDPGHIEALKRDATLSQLDAVKNGRILVAPMGAHTWGNRTVEQVLTVLWAASEFHPAQFPHAELVAEVKNFYATFFKTELNDAQVESILMSGRAS
ncbi:ABC transporter substrate-binding protein [Rhizobium sp. GCM10022189]|uniref:ABC transporter substrate-binding protein n=1 Tax=Rhizobium sp. GCM10022189 TaxID=3252654 RepID=UPI000DD86194